MKKTLLPLTLATLLAAMFLLFSIPVWREDALARKNRMRVNELIQLGQRLTDAEQTLKAKGFRLSYDRAIAPTIKGDYLQQLVMVGITHPNRFESIAYALELPWMPFTHRESPYVIIDATLEGAITRIE